VILLDTHAAIWLVQGHRRAGPLAQLPRLYLSPASVLELQFLVEVGRVRFAGHASPTTLAADDRWRLDDPPAVRWFTAACEVGWTRDPFDRLLAAHARLRGWKLATADAVLLQKMPASDRLAL
jgi:PIN domain nuclease of toxin-antitoxin system